MLQFILRRLGLVIPTFIGITLLTFAFVHMIPGDPVMIMAGERGINAYLLVGHDADHAGFGALEPDARLRSRERYGVPR